MLSLFYNNFCFLCKLQRNQIDRLDHESWEPRTEAEVRFWSKEWLLATTKKRRKEIFKEWGIRGSSLHQLQYRDPVKSIVVPIMHGVIEGIIQHHVRLKWGIGSDKPGAGSATQIPTVQPGPTPSPSPDVIIISADEQIVEDELEDLRCDSLAFEDATTSTKRARPAPTFIREEDDNLEDRGGEEEEEDDDSDDDGYDSDDVYEKEQPHRMVFDKHRDMPRLHDRLARVVLPSHIDRPPVNLGEKSHGKLKADNWHVLCTIMFPLTVPEIFSSCEPSEQELNTQLLDNFTDLVASTNIVCGYSVTPAEADRYLAHYLHYLRTSQILFPTLSTRPNHHYAIHNAAQLKWWGPLVKLGEFLYETHNGTLQKVKTNNHLWELDLTMLRQISRRGRLQAAIADSLDIATTNSPSHVVGAMKALSPSVPAPGILQPRRLTIEEEITHRASGVQLDPQVYDLILLHWNSSYTPTYLPRESFQYGHLGIDVHVMPVNAVKCTHFEQKTRRFSTFDQHSGSSSVSFTDPLTGQKNFGFIKSIWEMALQQRLHTFVVVQPHTALAAQDEEQTPYASRPGLGCFLGYTHPPRPQRRRLVEPQHLISHVPYLEMPAGTFGIQQEVTIFTDNLQRGRDM